MIYLEYMCKGIIESLILQLVNFHGKFTWSWVKYMYDQTILLQNIVFLCRPMYFDC